MLKRVLWLLSFVLLGWAIWRWWQDRTNDVFEATPQLASSVPPPDYARPSAPASPAPRASVPSEPPAPAAPPAAAASEPAPAGPAPSPDGELTDPRADAEVASEASGQPDKALALDAPPQDGNQDTGDSTNAPVPPEAAVVGQTAEDAPDTGEDESANEAEDETDGIITGYCVRCKAKRDMRDPQIETTENGRRAARGTCPVCEGTMFTFLKERAPGA